MKLFQGFLKIAAVLVLSLSAGLLAIILLSSNTVINSFLLRITIIAVIAFFGSIIGRILFRRLPGILLVLVVMVTNLFSVIVIDIFYENEYQFEFFLDDFHFQVPSVSDAGQFFFMLIISLPILLVFRHRKKKRVPAVEPARQSAKVTLSQRIKPVLHTANPRNWAIWKKIYPKPSKSRTSYQAHTPTVHVASPRAPTVKTRNGGSRAAIKTFSKKIKLPGKLFGAVPNDVKLVGDEEHVCPYCLEEVKKGNSAGVVVCKECGTWHHQDCWNLTGSCGVAHRNEL